MKNSRGRDIANVAGIIIAFLFILSASSGCGDKSAKGLIPEKDFTAILSDSYLANGLLSMPEIRNKFPKKDSTSNYADIIKSHGYTYEQMEKTLNYYFMDNPKQLVRIYDMISVNLNAIELKVTADQQKEIFKITEKTKKDFHFMLPDPELKRKPGFSFDIYPPGMFTHVFSVTVYPDDQSYHPSYIVWYSASEGPDAGKIKYLQEFRYIKDGWPHTFTVKGRIEGTGKSTLGGFYFDYGNNPGFSRQHAEIMNLNFSFMGDPR
jgi:hypothetical protein